MVKVKLGLTNSILSGSVQGVIGQGKSRPKMGRWIAGIARGKTKNGGFSSACFMRRDGGGALMRGA